MSDTETMEQTENVLNFPSPGQATTSGKLLEMERLGNLDRLSKSDLAAELKYARKILLKSVPWLRDHLTGDESVGDLADLVGDVIEAFQAQRTQLERRVADLEAIIHSAVHARANALGVGAQPAPTLAEQAQEMRDHEDEEFIPEEDEG